jgi:NAD(P)-dependent dehydrogenase (short-subunit alcohol dehydrogenase family)
MIEAAMNDLSGCKALVTGGGTGIGFRCAQALLAAGALVTIGRRRAEVLADAADQLDAGTGRVQTVTCDVTDEDLATSFSLMAINSAKAPIRSLSGFA